MRANYREAVSSARSLGDSNQLHRALAEFGGFESIQGNLAASWDLEQEALRITIEVGDLENELGCKQNLACTLGLMGLAAADKMICASRSRIAMIDESDLTASPRTTRHPRRRGEARIVASLMVGRRGRWERSGDRLQEERPGRRDRPATRCRRVEWSAHTSGVRGWMSARRPHSQCEHRTPCNTWAATDTDVPK